VNSIQRFSAKILLLGEYGIIKGSHGLAVPFHAYSGHLSFVADFEGKQVLSELYSYIQDSKILSEALDMDRLEKDIKKGLIFESNIPQGYGVGSSGALCAAVVNEYSNDFERGISYNQDELSYLKDIMALMESFYHGNSSGLDPLISFLNRPILIEKRHKIQILENQNLSKLGSFYLLDSKRNRKTSSLVHEFLKDCSNDSYSDKIESFISTTNQLTFDLLKNNKESFNKNINELSRFQYLNFSKMIVDDLKDLWLRGLETKDYFLKLCGAGGGGYYLVYSPEGIIPDEFSLIKIF